MHDTSNDRESDDARRHYLEFADGRWRAFKPGIFPRTNAVAGRVGRLRAYGNALDAETATQFCKTVKEIADEIGI